MSLETLGIVDQSEENSNQQPAIQDYPKHRSKNRTVLTESFDRALKLENRDVESDLDLTIIIPVNNEEQNIAQLSNEIESAIQPLSYSWECIWVDDGSTDNTPSELRRINKRDSHHQFISLSKNYGQSAALNVGFCHARGKILATLDGDCQNDPNDIPFLINYLLKNNVDMVNGVRQERKDTFLRKVSSRIANSFRNWVTKENVKDVGCSLRVLRHCCVHNIVPFKGMHRFLPTLVRIGGYPRVVEIPVRHRPRRHGRTHYGIHNRLWIGILDTLVVRWMWHRKVSADIKSTSLAVGARRHE